MDRNVIYAIFLSMLVYLAWESFINGPQRRAIEAEREAAAAQANGGTEVQSDLTDLVGGADGLSRDEALALAPGRVPIETPAITGSINLQGGRIDDLSLKNYRQSVDEGSPMVTVLNPKEAKHGYFVEAGLIVNKTLFDQVTWRVVDGERLTPTSPVTLEATKDGITVRKTISVDDKFMFTVTQEMVNETGGAASILPYGRVWQRDRPEDLRGMMILHEGPVGVIGEKLYERKYQNVAKKGGYEEIGTGGWLGLTGKYWLAAAIPPQDQSFKGTLDMKEEAETEIFRARYALDPQIIEAGETFTSTSYLFAGAKEVDQLRAYEKPVDQGGLGIRDFDKAVDWGNFFFLTRPIFNLLHFFDGIVGNYGVAILLMTVTIKLLLFPLANMGFKSMANMKKVQPELTKLREKHKDDQMAMQQAMMALYKKHNINPALGCLPILIQMPVFYALYKVLFVTLESRHEAFLYIPDLSEQDPTSVFNLFGLLPYDPTALPVVGAFLGIGVLPLLMGAAMYVQTKLNPPPTDKMQAQIFALMPLIFMVIMAPFAAGLVLYWFWNTFLGVLQQYFIMKRHGADVDIFGNIRRSFQKAKPESAAANDEK